MKKITAILIGAGQRGVEAYGRYAIDHPEEFQVVGVAEPNEARRINASKLYQIPVENQFSDYHEVFEREQFADCVMVCTQDRMHYEPTLMALKKGYHVLCEKPISADKKEIFEMVYAAKKYNKILSLCYVLRYSPFFIKLKKLLDSGVIGTLINVQYIENVGYWHHAHSFVRGNWRNAEESCPMILAKCCHDMDIIMWLLGATCKKVQSFGKLSYFKEENAPKGAPSHCMDGCEHRDDCPYYAPRFYLEHPRAKADFLVNAVSESLDTEFVLHALEHGPYGRCVFRCDNNVVDHQIVNMEFENNVCVSFTMTAFSKDCCREVNFMGTKGQIRGNMEQGKIEYMDFVTGNTEMIKIHSSDVGHSGSDAAMMKEFVRLLRNTGEGIQGQNTEVYIDSHLLAFAAEESRVSGKVVDFKEYKGKFEC
ncbi:MAG: Gfo/Idh/MocA family protein [Suilimivivens sp.]